MFRGIKAFCLGAALAAAAPGLAQPVQPAAVPDALANPDVVTVRNISRIELSPGVPIVDGSGNPLGTVKQVVGNTIVITDGGVDYRVPITQLYAYRTGAADHFASRLPKSALTAEQEGG
ncbi:hypothetical protein [Novosphingobium sp.]|uniref:hypothetical protein n=1 Tax=Novosphingobium sp. TaxID=1874826 RepID=UPI002B45A5E7|nr:hypothetical protein [Novosphingobium sp.]HKR91569.1 hypothetical protein [Novosphingobium sp.]